MYCDAVPQHECAMTHGQIVGLRPMKMKLIDKILSLDITWGLAFMGLVVMNCVLIRHINLTFTECLIESFSLGFAIPRLLK